MSKMVIFAPGERRDGPADDENQNDGVYGVPLGYICGIKELVDSAIWEDTAFEKTRIADRLLGREKK